METDYSTVIMQRAYTVKADEKTEKKNKKTVKFVKTNTKFIKRRQDYNSQEIIMMDALTGILDRYYPSTLTAPINRQYITVSQDNLDRCLGHVFIKSS